MESLWDYWWYDVATNDVLLETADKVTLSHGASNLHEVFILPDVVDGGSLVWWRLNPPESFYNPSK